MSAQVTSEDQKSNVSGLSGSRFISGIHYTVRGSGSETVVLLRGLGRWSEHWLGFEDLLAAKGLRVITIDNRGFGKSSELKVGKDLSIDQCADDVALVITKEAPFGAHVIGVSLGGMIGLSVAAMKPQLARSLVIVNSSIAGSKHKRLTGRAAVAMATVALGSKKGYQRLANALLGGQASEEKKAKMARAWAEIDDRSKPDLGRIWSQLLAARKFGGFVELAAVRCPVMVVKSEGDIFVDPANSDFIHKQLKNSTLMTHPSAGHELAFEDPEWFVDAIVRHVKA